jgi:RimJ/RimL family protein N-acetyltransferase
MTARLTAAPILETERTLLRPHRLDDFDAYCAMWRDPAVFRFIGGRARDREESWQRFLRHAGLWSFLGFGFWAIEEKASGRFVGEAGFHDLKRQIEPSIEGIPETGWALLPELHGKGLATEVMRRVLAFGDAVLGAPKTVCIIDPENVASLNVAQKSGYREFAQTTYHDHATIMLERLA